MGLTNTLNIAFQIERSSKRKKSIAIVISPEKGVIVRAPLRTPDHYIHTLLQQREAWIHKKLQVMAGRQQQTVQWENGEQFPYLGQNYTLELSPIPATKSSCEILDTHLFVRLRKGDATQKIVEAWYREQAKTVLKERTQYFAAAMQVQPNEILVKTQKRRWGSCDRYNTIRYNWKIVMAPLELLDYLVVHELAHIKEKNHSKAFWQVVEAALPDYLTKRTKLKNFHTDVFRG